MLSNINILYIYQYIYIIFYYFIYQYILFDKLLFFIYKNIDNIIIKYIFTHHN